MDPENHGDNNTIWEHLAVLRRYIIICIVSVMFFSIIAHPFYNQIVKIIFLPLHGKSLVFLSVIDPVLFILKIDLSVGFLISLPIISWLAFKFITPAFSQQNTKRIVLFFSSSLVLALASICYTYFLIAPLFIKFLSSIKIFGVENLITAQSYINFLLVQIAISAIIFQIPIVMAVATFWGLLNPYEVVKKRGWVYLGVVIGIGMFVPPDLFSHLVTIVPALIVFEISVLLCKIIYKRRIRGLKE